MLSRLWSRLSAVRPCLARLACLYLLYLPLVTVSSGGIEITVIASAFLQVKVIFSVGSLGYFASIRYILPAASNV